MTGRLHDPAWRNACCDVPAGECAHWMECEVASEADTLAAPALAPVARTAAPSIGQGLLAHRIGIHAGDSTLLQGVDLLLRSGEVGAILGPNGAGKSTLLSVLAGLRAPDTGAVWLNGQPLLADELHRVAQHRAVLPQDTAVAFDFTVQEVVALGRYPHRLQPSRREADIVQAAMAATGVSAMAHRPVGSLSGGERARAQLARVMAQIWEAPPDGAPRWLLLDEPTAALDLRYQHATLSTVRRWAREQGVGVLAVLHDLNLALRYTDQVWVLDRGRLQVGGVPAEVLTPALVQRVWQVQATAVRSADGVSQLLIAADAPLHLA
ncbi:MAG TPA: heme ABC transporter ATP-binding protein [Hydrogenophaga sp.]|nr:heme ABC transporter ATP-binding protein [Hydrogenophaga sp.]